MQPKRKKYMNHFLLCTILITIFFNANAMNISQRTSFMWAITKDKHLVEIDTMIAQQSNLLTVLQEKYEGTYQNPIPIPIDKESFKFLCSCLTIPAQQLLINLTHENYSQLIDVAEKLKCSIFYAELMEQLLPIKELINAFALTSINNMRALKKATYKSFLKKICIKKCKHHRINTINLIYSPDGTYFLENISRNESQCQVSLWNTEQKRCIKTFPGYAQALFSPSNDYIILYKNVGNGKGLDIAPLLYSITHDISIPLLNDYENYSWYTPTIHSSGNYIMQKTEYKYESKCTLIHYIKDEKRIQKIILEDDLNNSRAFDFDPDSKFRPA